MNSSEISVIVTTFNDGKFLEDCLSSIFLQTKPASEIIVVDDGSNTPDSILKICEAKEKYPEVIFISQQNGGAAAARNTGLFAAKSESICFIDVDDRLHPDNLSIKHRLLTESQNKYICAYGGFEGCNPNNSIFYSSFKDSDGPINTDRIGRPNGIPGGLPMYMFKTEALRKIGGLDENLNYMEDFDLLLRLGMSGERVRGCNYPIYKRTIRSGSLSRGIPRRIFLNKRLFLSKASREQYFSISELFYRYLECYWVFCRESLRGLFLSLRK